MGTPSTAIARPDLGVTFSEFDLAANRGGFIALRMLPIFDAPLAAATFGRIPIGEWLKARDDTRAPGGGYSRQNWKFTEDAYQCVEHGVEQPVDDRNAKMYAYMMDQERISAELARDGVLRNLEARVAKKLSDTAVWTGSALTLAVSNAWSVKSSATPVEDVKLAMQKFRLNCGMVPNVLQLTWNKYKDVRECDEIVDRIKFSGRDDPKSVTPQMLAAIFDVEEVVVAGGIKNSANEGQAASLASVWDDTKGMLAYVNRGMDFVTPQLGRTFSWTANGGNTSGGIFEYRDEPVKANIIRATMDTDEHVLEKQCGFLLTGL